MKSRKESVRSDSFLSEYHSQWLTDREEWKDVCMSQHENED